MHPRSTNVFGGSAHAEVTGVDVHRGRFWNIAWHNCALVEVQVFHLVDNASNVIRILRYRFAVLTCLVIGDVHSGACSAEIGIGTPWLHVVLRSCAYRGKLRPAISSVCSMSERGNNNRPFSSSLQPFGNRYSSVDGMASAIPMFSRTLMAAS